VNTSIPWSDLEQFARTVRQRAYAPYSKYLVGSALLADDGQIYVGCNVENASYGLTICAERSALTAMISQGAQRVQGIIVITGGTTAGSPCGMCRQCLAEFCEDAPVRLLALTPDGQIADERMTSVAQLLPERFRGDLVVAKDPLAMKKARWLVQGGTLVTCNATNDVLVGDLAIDSGRIVAVGPKASEALAAPYQVIKAKDCAILPGLIQSHVHLVQALFRGLADNLPLLEWLKTRIWPLEASHDDASLQISAELGICEMLRAGTTAILDMGTVHGHDAVFETCERLGMRVTSGKAMMDTGEGVPAGLMESTDESLRSSEKLATTWSGRGNGRLRYAYAPRFILSCSERLLRESAELARAGGHLIHTHAAEHQAERDAVRTLLGDEDIAILAKYGITGPDTVLAHCVQVTEQEQQELARVRTSVVHCPSANLKLGSGIAPVHAMRRAGVTVGLGHDGAPCNNNMDPWVEIRHAALLAKIRSGTTSLPAMDVLRMATIDGARVLGLESEIGSLEVGKQADVIVVRLDDICLAPAIDVVSTLVYACQSRHVSHVFVQGQLLVNQEEILEIDQARLVAQTKEHALRIAKKAKVL
jgi:5-methylthioadenosine/S-adenosylhomocysteine deaminase